MNTFTTFVVTKKAVAATLAAATILGGGVAAEASGVTAALTGQSETHASVTGKDKTLDVTASLDANEHASGRLDKAQATINREGGESAGIGAQVSAEARTHRGSMKEFVHNLLGLRASTDAHGSASVNDDEHANVNSDDGAEDAIEAVAEAKAEAKAEANEAADDGPSTAIDAIGSGHVKVTHEANVNAEAGLSKALNAVTSAGSEASGGASSDANANARTTLEGLSASGSATTSTGLRLGLRSR